MCLTLHKITNMKYFLIAIVVLLFSCDSTEYNEVRVKHKIVSQECEINPASTPIWPHVQWKITLENGDVLYRQSSIPTTQDSVEYIYLTPKK